MIDYNIVIDELTRVGAVKVIMSNYDEAWLLRNHINSELRRQGLKSAYTSAVIDTTLIVWKIELYGKKGSKHLVSDMLNVFKLTPSGPQVNIEDLDISRVFEELKKEEVKAKEKRIKDIIDKLGK